MVNFKKTFFLIPFLLIILIENCFVSSGDSSDGKKRKAPAESLLSKEISFCKQQIRESFLITDHYHRPTVLWFAKMAFLNLRHPSVPGNKTFENEDKSIKHYALAYYLYLLDYVAPDDAFMVSPVNYCIARRGEIIDLNEKTPVKESKRCYDQLKALGFQMDDINKNDDQATVLFIYKHIIKSELNGIDLDHAMRYVETVASSLKLLVPPQLTKIDTPPDFCIRNVNV